MKKVNLKARVARGVKFMEKFYGLLWWKRIDPEQLALESGSACILGQVDGDYTDAIEELGLSSAQAEALGFTLGDSAQDAVEAETDEYAFDQLTSTWRERIVRARSKWENS